MRRSRFALAALVAGLMLLVPLSAASDGEAPSGAYALTLTPDPVAPGEPFTVRVNASDAPLESGVLKVCYSEDRDVQLCLLPKEMRSDGNGGLLGDAEGLPPGQEFGVNMTLRHADGRVVEYPGHGEEYVFFQAAAMVETPGAGLASAFVALAAAAALKTRRSR